MTSSGRVWDSPTVVCVHKLALEGMPGPVDFERGARELFGAMDLRPDRPVLIKPNVVQDMAPDSGIVTHPAFVGGMVDHLLAAGLRKEEIVIAEGGGVDEEGYTWDMREIYGAAGYVSMAAERGVRLMDLNRDESVRVSVDGQIFSEIGIARAVQCAGRYVINVPKLKTHNLAVMTLSMKNLQGVIVPIQERHLCPIHPLDFSPEHLPRRSEPLNIVHPRQLPASERARWFEIQPSGLTAWEEAWAKKICDLSLAVQPDLNVVEGIVGRDGSGFRRGTNHPTGLAVAGVNPVAVDAVASYLVGSDPREIGHLALAAERGIGTNDLDRIAVYEVRDGELVRCDDLDRLAYPTRFHVIRGWEEMLRDGL